MESLTIEFYQFAYFLRKTEPHSVLIKVYIFCRHPSQSQIGDIQQTRRFTAATPQHKQSVKTPEPQSSRTKTGKRKPDFTAGSLVKGRKKRKTKGKGKACNEVSDEESALSSGDDSNPFMSQSPTLYEGAPRRSGRVKKLVAGGYRQDEDEETDYAGADIEMSNIPDEPRGTTTLPHNVAQYQTGKPAAIAEEDGSINEQSNTAILVRPLEEEAMMEEGPSEIFLVADREEMKPKPVLQLKYQGFNIFGNCLCVVVEPWPPIQAVSRVPTIASIFSNATRISTPTPELILGGQVDTMRRERTPLFLPDPDRGRSETPVPFNHGKVLPPVPFFNDSVDEGMDGNRDASLIEFSQALSYAGDHRGALEDDDEMDGAVFFGDADETREF
jgi:hypothetical protein